MTDWSTISRLWREASPATRRPGTRSLTPPAPAPPELRRQLDSLLEPASGRSGRLRCLVDGFQLLWEELKSASDDSQRSTTDPIVVEQRTQNILFKSSAFSILGADTLADLLKAMHLQECEPGEYLILQGDPAEFLLLILSGYASARVRDMPPDRAASRRFRSGEIVGEISLVTDEPRTADVVARTFVRALRLSASDFHVLADRHPDLLVVFDGGRDGPSGALQVRWPRRQGYSRVSDRSVRRTRRDGRRLPRRTR